MRKLVSRGGGTNYHITLGLIYLGIAIYNVFDYWGVVSIESMAHTVPFVLIFILLLTKIKKQIDIIIDFLIMIVIITISIVGEFSGVALLYLLLFRVKDNKTSIIFLFVCILAISLNTLIFQNEIVEAFKTIFVFGFFLLKYYYIIHKPTNRLYQRVKYLENELFRLGPAKPLTDDQIIQKYPFMYHPRENQYRRIEDVRMLADGLSVKEIASIAEVEPNTISREFDDLKVNIGVFIDTKIMSKEQLVKVCIELGIIEVSFIHR